MAEPLVVGSEHLLEGYMRDRESDGTLSPIDLGAASSVQVKIKLQDGTVRTITGAKDPDQVTNKGKYTAQLAATDITYPGEAKVQAVLVIGSRTHKSAIVERAVEESL